MSREEAFHTTLEAIAKMQWNVVMILEAKAMEAEKVRNWLINHVTNDTYDAHNEQLSTSLHFNEQNIEIIDGLSKLCNSLSRNMKVILHPESNETDNMASMLGGFDTGDRDQ
jgi:hypothetical protein